jgi:Xaa-Pro aminopeptidase
MLRKEQRRRRDLDNANRQEDGDGHPNAELMALKVVTTDQFQDFKKSMQMQIQQVKDMVPSAVFVNSSGPATENSAMNASVLRQMNQLTDTLRNLSDRVDRMEQDKYEKEVEQIKEAHAKHLQCLGAFMQILVAQLKNDSYTETLLQSYRQMFKIQETCGMQFLDSAFRKFVFGARGQAAESDD